METSISPFSNVNSPANSRSATAAPARPERITGRRPLSSASRPQREEVSRNSTADDEMIAPTWNSVRPMLRPNRPTVARTVVFPIIMMKTARRTTVVATAQCSPIHLYAVK